MLVTTTAEFNAALKGAKGGETITLAPGTYSGLLLNGITAAITITSADPAKPAILTAFTIANCSNLTFAGLELDARQTANESYYAFRVTNCTNVEFGTMQVHGDDDPNKALTGFLVRDSRDVRILGSHFTNLLNGIVQQDNERVTFSDNLFELLAGDGIDNTRAKGVTIQRNGFRNFVVNTSGQHQDAIQGWTEPGKAPLVDMLITDNWYERAGGAVLQGIFLNDEAGNLPYRGLVIERNRIEGALYHGIAAYNAIDPVLTDNIVQGYEGQQSWLALFGGSGAKLTNNKATDLMLGPNGSWPAPANVQNVGSVKLAYIPVPETTSTPAPTPTPAPEPAPSTAKADLLARLTKARAEANGLVNDGRRAVYAIDKAIEAANAL